MRLSACGKFNTSNIYGDTMFVVPKFTADDFNRCKRSHGRKNSTVSPTTSLTRTKKRRHRKSGGFRSKKAKIMVKVTVRQHSNNSTDPPSGGENHVEIHLRKSSIKLGYLQVNFLNFYY